MSHAHDVVVEHLVSAFHPAFAGHFPGAPIWPGVALLSGVMEELIALAMVPASARGQWEGVKFLAPVGPGALLCIMLRPRTQGFAFEVTQGPTLVARGQWVAVGEQDVIS